ncbi:PREDICTED: V-set and immunoglobulin domain-containing protein 4-like, partial [Buceros rhinoceros silvestris]|uniref:V-set and immunoglobulin domain-containing protein 4-like n=1 Tax=Buceros rhinoceros silvestris TaxID=175836 RepID=UPI000528ED11
METLVRAAVLMSPLLLCNAPVLAALLDLTGSSQIKGVWKDSATLPCAYEPVKEFVQETVAWTVKHDQSSGTILRRDSSGDHILLAEYRDRVSIPTDSPGNVSLHIQNLEVSDRGAYTCQVTWKAQNNSLIARDITTKVEVVKGKLKKESMQAWKAWLGKALGPSTSLSGVSSGSPPISYRWFRSSPGGKAQLLSRQAELAWDNLRPSDTGTYYCEAENRAGAGAVQRSDAVQLTVRDPPTMTVASPTDVGTLASPTDVGTSGTYWPTTGRSMPTAVVTPENTVGYPEKNYTSSNFQRTHLPLYLVILIAVGCGAVVFLVIFLIVCLRKPKE